MLSLVLPKGSLEKATLELFDAPDLTVPHPRAHLRAFVLRPWLDIQPYAQLPGHGWLHELVRAEEVAADLAELRARDDVDLEEAPTA